MEGQYVNIPSRVISIQSGYWWEEYSPLVSHSSGVNTEEEAGENVSWPVISERMNMASLGNPLKGGSLQPNMNRPRSAGII